jgi:hypothetical protein
MNHTAIEVDANISYDSLRNMEDESPKSEESSNGNGHVHETDSECEMMEGEEGNEDTKITSFWEANSETDDSAEFDHPNQQSFRYELQRDHIHGEGKSDDEFNDIFVYTTRNNPMNSILQKSTLTHVNKPQSSMLKKLTYDDIKKRVASHYEQSIIHKYSSAVDVLTCYVKCYCFLFHEASALCQSRLNVLMLPCIFISSICSVLSGFSDWSVVNLTVIVAILNALVSFLLALVSFLKLDACSEAHTISVFQYNKVKGYLEFTSGEILLFQNPLLLNNGVMERMNEWKTINKNLFYLNRKEYYKQKYEKIRKLYAEKRELEQQLVLSLQKKIDEVKRMMKDIKENNRFIIPKQIIEDFHIIYNINIFTFLKNIDNYKMNIITRLKNIRNETRFIINKRKHHASNEEDDNRIKELYRMKNNAMKELIALNNGHGMLDMMFQQMIINSKLKKTYWLRFLCVNMCMCMINMSYILPENYKDPYDCGIICDDGVSLLKKLL